MSTFLVLPPPCRCDWNHHVRKFFPLKYVKQRSYGPTVGPEAPSCSWRICCLCLDNFGTIYGWGARLDVTGMRCGYFLTLNVRPPGGKPRPSGAWTGQPPAQGAIVILKPAYFAG